MFGVLVRWLAVISQCYRYFVDSPIKQTMPIFTEWLIPEALGLHTEIWLQATPILEGAGFHRVYSLDLAVREKAEAQCQINWDLTRIEITWRLPRDFCLDPWELDRQPAVHRHEGVETWIQWNTEDLKAIMDLEAPAYSPRAVDFTLKASVFVRKILDPHLLQWNLTVSIPDVLVRYQDPRLEVSYVEDLMFPRPRIRLISVDPSRSIPTDCDFHA